MIELGFCLAGVKCDPHVLHLAELFSLKRVLHIINYIPADANPLTQFQLIPWMNP